MDVIITIVEDGKVRESFALDRKPYTPVLEKHTEKSSTKATIEGLMQEGYAAMSKVWKSDEDVVDALAAKSFVNSYAIYLNDGRYFHIHNAKVKDLQAYIKDNGFLKKVVFIHRSFNVEFEWNELFNEWDYKGVVNSNDNFLYINTTTGELFKSL